MDLALNADGKILEIEKEIPVDELPRAVKKRLAARYPGAKIEKVEEITKGEDGPVHYEVAIKAEVVFTAKGKIVKPKGEDEEDEKPAAKAKKKEKEEERTTMRTRTMIAGEGQEEGTRIEDTAVKGPTMAHPPAPPGCPWESAS